MKISNSSVCEFAILIFLREFGFHKLIAVYVHAQENLFDFIMSYHS